MKNQSSGMYSIYALQIAETGEPFYIGMCRYIKWRLKGHKADKLRNSIKYAIVRNNKVEAVEIDTAETKEEAAKKEAEHIEKYRQKGYFLCNKVRMEGKRQYAYLVNNRKN